MHPMVRSTDKSKRKGLGPLGGEDSDARIVRSQFSKSSSSDSASTDMQEESLPWRSLPSDILERALALLPLPDFFRLRCFCKRWKELPFGRLNARFTNFNVLIVDKQRNSYKILLVGNCVYKCSIR